jgi:phosphotriesterase-related protein
MKRIKILICLPIAISLLIVSCDKTDKVLMTVKGPIPADQAGMVLHHEHVMVDFIGAAQTGYHRWDRQAVIPVVAPYLMEIQPYGVNMLMECTPAYLGRDPRLLVELSEECGINLVTNTGYYGAAKDKHVPEHAFTKSVDELAALWIGEFENGIEDTGVRPGFLKIAVDDSAGLSATDEKIVRAAARTHLKTGLAIASHTGPDGPAFAQLEILIEEGVSPEAFIWVHAQGGTMEGHVQAAKMGAWISLDYVTADSANIEKNVAMIEALKNKGYLNRILLSHDAGWYTVGEPGGGSYRGYTAIFTHLIPRLKEKNFTDQDIR